MKCWKPTSAICLTVWLRSWLLHSAVLIVLLGTSTALAGCLFDEKPGHNSAIATGTDAGDGDAPEGGETPDASSPEEPVDPGPPPDIDTGCPCFGSLCIGSCNGHGECMRRTEDDTACRCYEGYYGPDCFFAAGSCKNDCSGNGYCDTETGQCQCDPGYWGDDCSATEWTACPGMCSGYGHCDLATGTCTCSPNTVMGQPSWWGEDCSIPGCLNYCSGHGTCTRLDCASCPFHYCECDPGWGGPDCSQPVAQE